MDGLPEFLQPRLRLFLSADIVGSTALKQAPREAAVGAVEWSAIIQGFYAETQTAFLSHWAGQELKIKDHFDPGPRPEFWKVIGDEIVFSKILTDYRQMAATLAAWYDALQQVRRFVKARRTQLDVKCTAWTAGFPVMNKEVVVFAGAEAAPAGEDYFKESGELLNRKYRGEKDLHLTVDYIGPAIDIGFRLCAHSTPRKMMLSVGVAYILSLTSLPKKLAASRDLKVVYEGSEPLKGVFGGVPYPLFWIDMAVEGDLAKLEDALVKRDRAVMEDISAYCEKFYEDNHVYTFPPFIDGDGGAHIKIPPPWYKEIIEKLAKTFSAADLLYLDKSTEAEAEAEEKLHPADQSEKVPSGDDEQVEPDTDLRNIAIEEILKSISRSSGIYKSGIPSVRKPIIFSKKPPAKGDK